MQLAYGALKPDCVRLIATTHIALIAVCIGTSGAGAQSFLPDHARTPGAMNPAITQATIGKTICNRGHWSTRRVRPPASYTNRLKRGQLAAFGYRDTDPKHFEEDHLIPLTLGGNPRDPKNLWPEPWDGACGAHAKDRLEVKLNRLVCTGQLKLRAAQRAIATNWISAYQRFVGAKSCH